MMMEVVVGIGQQKKNNISNYDLIWDELVYVSHILQLRYCIYTCATIVCTHVQV